MQPDFEKLFSQLPVVGQRTKRWIERFNQAYRALEKQNERRLRSEASQGLAAYQRAHAALRQMAIKEAGLDELNTIFTFCDRLCLVYLNADDEQRERLRQLASNLLWLGAGHFVTSRAEKIHTAADIELLRIALAAISIANWTYYPGGASVRADYPDATADFDLLIQKSQQAAIDILPHLEAVAALSSEKPSHAAPHSPSMRTMMQEIANKLARERNAVVAAPPCPDISPLGSPATLLANAVPIGGQISDATAILVYRFVAKAGDVVTLDMQRTHGDLDAFLGLVDSRGNVLIRSAGSDPRQARIGDFQVKTTGCYYVYASRKGLGDGKTSGGFNLILSGASSFI
jgi:hypothetical protein